MPMLRSSAQRVRAVTSAAAVFMSVFCGASRALCYRVSRDGQLSAAAPLGRTNCPSCPSWSEHAPVEKESYLGPFIGSYLSYQDHDFP